MRVLMFTLDPKMADQQSAVRARHREYAEQLHELVVVVLAKTGRTGTEQIGPLTLVYRPQGGRFKALYWLTGLVWGVKEGKRQLARLRVAGGCVVVSSPEPFGVGLIAYLVAWSACAPLHIQVHTDISSKAWQRESVKNRLFLLLAKFLLPRAQGVRVVSARVKRFLVELRVLSHESRIRALPVFVDTEKFRVATPAFDLKKKYPQFEQIVLVVSRLVPEKRVDLAIQVFAEVHKTFPKTGLIIVGEGPERANLESRISDLESLRLTPYALRPSIVFAGWSNDLASYYKGADVLLVTSKYEGYGMQIVEALASGCPVVSTDVGIAREAGATVVENEEELAPALEDTLRHKSKGELRPDSTISKQDYLDRWRKSLEQCLS